jgi:hypothetical protein
MISQNLTNAMDGFWSDLPKPWLFLTNLYGNKGLKLGMLIWRIYRYFEYEASHSYNFCSQNQMSAPSDHPARADWEADEKRRPRLYTGKGEEKEDSICWICISVEISMYRRKKSIDVSFSIYRTIPSWNNLFPFYFL